MLKLLNKITFFCLFLTTANVYALADKPSSPPPPPNKPQGTQQMNPVPPNNQNKTAVGNIYAPQNNIQKAKKPTVACRKAGCSRINDKITSEFLFNSVMQLFWNNANTKAYLCEADPNTRACLSPSIGYGAQIGQTPAVITIPSLTIAEVKFTRNLKAVNLLFMYDVLVNGIQAECTSAYNTINIRSGNELLLKDNNYTCNLTADMPSTAFSIYNIDYIDLDYGILGGYYSIGLTGPSQGGGTGYMLMKLNNEGEITDADKESFFGDAASGKKATDVNLAPGEYRVRPLIESFKVETGED